MKNFSCIIIEDEVPARDLLRSYIAKLEGWKLLAEFENAIDAARFLSSNKVDLIFLDIELPGLNGIEFLQSMDERPKVIICSAYSEHAVDAFELLVFDYLLKPYAFNRFLKSMLRLEKALGKEESDGDLLQIKSNRETIQLRLNEILYIESQKEYSLIVTKEGSLRTKMGITKLEDKIKDGRFLRIHRSFIVNKDLVDSFSSSQLRIQGIELPIGRLYRKQSLEALDKS